MCRLTKQFNHDTIDTEVIQMKIGTIGTGFIVEWFITAVDHNENCECLAVFSRKEETGRALADKFNVKKVYTDFEEMLKDEEIDFILSFFVDFTQQYGRIKMIKARNPLIYSALADICQRCSIELTN